MIVLLTINILNYDSRLHLIPIFSRVHKNIFLYLNYLSLLCASITQITSLYNVWQHRFRNIDFCNCHSIHIREKVFKIFIYAVSHLCSYPYWCSLYLPLDSISCLLSFISVWKITISMFDFFPLEQFS